MGPLRPRRPGATAAHQEAVARRLALLDAELTAVRTGAGSRPGAAGRRDEEAVAGPGRDDGDHGDRDGSDWDDWDEWDEVGDTVSPGAPTAGGWDVAPANPAPDTHTRVRPAGVPGARPAPDVEVVLGEVATPGRHASRRPGRPAAAEPAPGLAGRPWLAALPETLRGRTGLGAAHLAVVAVLVSLGLGVTCWWVLRSAPDPLPPTSPAGALVTPSATAAPGVGAPTPAAPAATAPSGAGDPVGGAGSAGSAGEAGEVVVDVAGKVRRPGIAVLPAGSRVADALAAAGGARPGVDLTGLNLARVLLDGEQVLVGVVPAAVPGAPGAPGAPATTAPGVPAVPGAPAALVDLNTADLALLDTLPGVGPVTAQAILDWRAENGGFTAVEDLLDVSGIGEVTLAELTPLVTV
ncbi:hypothetical protein GCM10009737_35080 [Nocardioides lentus]|uniref:Helix-hairpin-helix DNA-binding motif class 1 domain-containing protein n=1 Tax=Nocardioides lentus TaxID=338077 RepID=A0ABN2PV38_9ACTN